MTLKLSIAVAEKFPWSRKQLESALAPLGHDITWLHCTAATGTDLLQGRVDVALLDPAGVSPGLLALVGEDAPIRAILCAGAGHFARANVTLTPGVQVGLAADAGEQLVASWEAVSNREGEMVPADGFFQAERELAAAGHHDEKVAVHG